MNVQLFCAVLLGVCIGALFATGLCSVVFAERKQRLFALGHVVDNRTYFFRLPLDKKEASCTPQEIVTLARNELQDAGVPDDVLGRVSISASGVMLTVEGKPEDVEAAETTHKLWLKAGVA